MFLDIEKTYDTVNRKIMRELVERLGFDEHIKILGYKVCTEIQ